MIKKLGVFIAGTIAGAAAAYFTSPRSGFENRNLAKDAVNAVLETAHIDPVQATRAVQTATEKGQELANQAAERTHEFYATASTKVQEVAAGVAPGVMGATDNDELRQKIEAARQRIAAQVVKNAEESQLVEAEPVAVEEVVVEAVEAVEPEAAE